MLRMCWLPNAFRPWPRECYVCNNNPSTRCCSTSSLPEVRDLSAIDQVRRVSPGVAIMLLAGAVDQALARRAVESGATDYVVTTDLDTRSLCQLIAMMFERRGLDEQKFVERERAEITLNSIGDAVLTTDTLAT